MKKVLCVFLSLLIILSAGSIIVFAADDQNPTDVNTILDDDNEDETNNEVTNDDAENAKENAGVTDEDKYFDGVEDDNSTTTVYKTIEVTVTVAELYPNRIVYCIDQNEITIDEVKEAYVVINGQKYESTFLDFFDSPDQSFENCVIAQSSFSAKMGDTVEMHFIMTDGTDITEKEEIEEGPDEAVIDICDVNHAVFYYLSDTDKAKSITLTVNGKKVNYKNFTGEDREDYDEESFEYAYIYEAKYKIKYNSSVKLTVLTESGYVYEDTVKAEDVEPEIKINTFYAGDTILSGKTRENSSVKIKAGKKTYKCKSNKKGVFRKKIKPVNAGKIITVKVTAPSKMSKQKSIKVKKAKGKVSFVGTIKESAKKIRIRITNSKVGDIVTLNTGTNSYKKTVKKAKNTFVLNFNVKKLSKKTTLSVRYTDMFKTVKSTAKTKVN
ncbi:MAG: hypothetical protein IIU14_00340 [Ruminococcus sp.]|nr:hypothetical protein [Ruminococcus sp.]